MWMSKANPKRYVLTCLPCCSQCSPPVHRMCGIQVRTHRDRSRVADIIRQCRRLMAPISVYQWMSAKHVLVYRHHLPLTRGKYFHSVLSHSWLADRKKSGLCHISNGSLQQQPLLCFIEFGYIQCGSPGNNRRRVDHISEPHAKFCEKRSIMKTEFAPLWNPNSISGFISNRI